MTLRQSAEEKVREKGREEVNGGENEERAVIREARTKKERQWYERLSGEVKRMETLTTEASLSDQTYRPLSQAQSAQKTELIRLLRNFSGEGNSLTMGMQEE